MGLISGRRSFKSFKTIDKTFLPANVSVEYGFDILHMSTFIYIQSVDCGLAPCVQRGVWSLALCKPGIRKQARKGDVVIAVTPIDDGHRLSSWACIEDRITTAEF